MKKKEVENKEELLNDVEQFLNEEKSGKKVSKKVKKEEVVEVKEEKKTKTIKEEKEANEKTISIEKIDENLVEEKEEVTEEKKETKKKTTKKPKKEIDVEKVKAIEEMFDDDLYITRAFKPVKTKTKVKRGLVKFLIWGIIFAVVGIVVFTLGKSYIENKTKTKPINVFKHVVKTTSDTAIKYLEELEDSYGSTYEFKIDTNMNKYNILDDKEFGISFYNKDNYIMEYIYLDSGYGIYNIKNDKDNYIKYSSSNKLIRTNETDSMLRDIFLIRNNKDDLKYIINESNDIFNKIVEDKYFQVSNQTITINGNEVDVIENSFIIDRYIKRELIKDYISEVKKDKELIEAFANLFNVNKDDVTKVIEDKLNKINSDNIVFNVYTDKKYNMIGIDLEIDGFTEAYVYKYDDRYDIQFNVFKYLDKFMNELEVDVKTNTNLGFSGTKDDVSFAINKNLKSSFKIEEFNKNRISINYMGINGKYFNIDINIKSNSMALNLNDYNVLSSNTKIKKEKENFYELLDDNEDKLIDYLIELYYE